MPREPENYRPYLEDILTYTGGRRVMTAKEAMAYTGKSRHWLNNRGLNSRIGAIQAIQLARVMAAMDGGGR